MWNPLSWKSTFGYMAAGAGWAGSKVKNRTKKKTRYNYRSAEHAKFTRVNNPSGGAPRMPSAAQADPLGTLGKTPHAKGFFGYHTQYARVGAKKTGRATKRQWKSWGEGPKGFGKVMTGAAGAGTGTLAAGGYGFGKAMNKLDEMRIPGADVMTMAALVGGMTARMDSYHDSPQDHSSRMHAALGAVSTEAFDTMLLGAAATMGPVGLLAAGLSSVAGENTGVGIPQMVERSLGSMADQLESDQYGKKTVSQNERTMRAASEQMSLITQTGFAGNELINPQSFSARRRGLLGNEAMLMHN